MYSFSEKVPDDFSFVWTVSKLGAFHGVDMNSFLGMDIMGVPINDVQAARRMEDAGRNTRCYMVAFITNGDVNDLTPEYIFFKTT